MPKKFFWKVTKVSTFSSAYNIYVSKYKNCSFPPPGGVMCQKNYFQKVSLEKLYRHVHFQVHSKCREIRQFKRALQVLKIVWALKGQSHSRHESEIFLFKNPCLNVNHSQRYEWCNYKGRFLLLFQLPGHLQQNFYFSL